MAVFIRWLLARADANAAGQNTLDRVEPGNGAWLIYHYLEPRKLEGGDSI